MNNAALERLASVTDRVQARPVPSALEKAPAKRSVSLEGDHSGDAAKEVVATPKALKSAEHEKRRNWRRS